MDDVSVVTMLVESWFDAFETHDWRTLDAEFGDDAVVLVPAPRGTLRHFKPWPAARDSLQQAVERAAAESPSKVKRRDIRVEVFENLALVSLREGHEPWTEGALILTKATGHWRLSHMQFESLGLLTDTSQPFRPEKAAHLRTSITT